MRRAGLVAVLAVTVGLAVPAAAGEDAARAAVRERLADMLAGENLDKVEFRALDFDQAMRWIYLAVDTYLDRAAARLGGDEAAGEYGAEILAGLEDHTVRYADEQGLEVVGEQVLRVESDEQARQLGELLYRVAELLREAHVGRGVALRSAARKVFETMAPVAGNRQSLVTQYVVRMRSLTPEERRDMVRWLQGG